MTEHLPEKRNRPLAMALIDERYLKRGETTRIVVVPWEGCGLPQGYIDRGEPVALDVLANRPTNVVMDHKDGLWVDLCFGGPPQRCHFEWPAVMLVQGDGDALVQCTVISVLTENSKAPPKLGLQPEAERRVRPSLRAIDGGKEG